MEQYIVIAYIKQMNLYKILIIQQLKGKPRKWGTNLDISHSMQKNGQYAHENTIYIISLKKNVN